VTYTPSDRASAEAEPDLLDLDAALVELAAFDEPQARLIELRFFGGLSVEEAAAVMRVSRTTANREWQTAKAWLYRRLKRPRGRGRLIAIPPPSPTSSTARGTRPRCPW
jgi:DNA-directed RNA polymerase specialized sigma24 family protein